MIENNSNLDGICAANIMNAHFKSIEASELAANAAVIMRDTKISQLVVMEAGNYTGMIHIHDLNKEGLL
jgi:arabinose-5-phosphate isomerase